ncbi:MAG: amidohydrolase family protein [Rhodospirillales bacterium]|jgi:aminocarboxymuconate-semialdehyde decarboxylase|nr:2-amino-3-carboxymuconate-6-semialdehyde decarboxylase [Rhodospirillaceae bacterium]MDP6427112.1 amidohydrolase family protein [Rhodospirillales bacterium]MDP6645723.1 amidohydrolase family protein [Rhodospirillales bacterium]MDP6840985.1 amidohydrolase family protein [Rhodospirillales bacterium]
MHTVIDVHTHMLNEYWLEQLVAHGGKYALGEFKGERVIRADGAPFMTLKEPMFDYAKRIEDMDEAGVDIAIVSLTCPSVYWGSEEVSSATAQFMNDDMAAQQKIYPDRIRYFATLPWQFPDRAVEELARACGNGAVGVFVSANISGMSLTDAHLKPIWDAIEARALPVLVHPSAPPGVGDMDMQRYNLVGSVGFMFDTTLAVSRMIFDGFFDRYTNLKIIACHAGGALPYLFGRLDIAHQNMPGAREVISELPSSYADRLYYDTVTFTQGALELCIDVAGSANMLYGSDYPHNIGDMKGCLARVDALPADQRDAARGGNAERIFNL